MNGRQRILAAAARRPVDMLPVMPQIFGHAAVLAGIPLADYLGDGELVATCQVAAWRHYGHDAVFGFLDAAVETEAMGAEIAAKPGCYPHVVRSPFTVDADFAAVAPPDPVAAGRMPEVLQAIRLLRAAVADEALVVGCVQGPATLAAQLVGLEQSLFLAADDPAAYARLLDLATAVGVRYGAAQLTAGADLALIFEPVASSTVLPLSKFTDLVLPRLRTILAAFQRAGAVTSWLHVAGASLPILPFYSEAGVAIGSFDYCVSPIAARRAAPTLCLCGNIKPLSFVIDPPAEIEREVAALRAAMADGSGFILSSGCEIPPEAPPDRVMAMMAAAGRGGG